MHTENSTRLVLLLAAAPMLREIVETDGPMVALRWRGWRRYAGGWRRRGSPSVPAITALVYEAEREIARWLLDRGWRALPMPGGLLAAVEVERAVSERRISGAAA